MKRTSGREHGHRAKENKERKRRIEALSLSPERLEDGATTTTEVLSGILSRPQPNHYSRHWGINE
jgi:hypothetical protein